MSVIAEASNALNTLVSDKEESFQIWFKPITRVSSQFICQDGLGRPHEAVCEENCSATVCLQI